MIDAEEQPEAWKLHRLADICLTKTGGTPSRRNPDYFTGTIPWVKSGELEDSFVTQTEESITEQAVVESNAKLFPKGTLLMAMYGATVGKLGRLAMDATTNQAICAFFPKPELDSGFLWHYLRAIRPELLHSRFGAAQPNISQTIIKELEIPLPPLGQQKRLVARIEAMTSRLEEACALRQQTAQQSKELLRTILTSDKKAKLTRMRDLVSLRSPDVAVRNDETYQFAGVYSFGRGVFRSAAKSGSDFAYQRLTRVKAGEFVYPKLMAWEGALGMVPPECDGCVVSTEFPVFEVNSDRVFPEVLDVYFRTPSVWPELAGLSVGTNVRRRRLNPQAFLDYEMALPSRETQIKLRGAWAKQAELRRLQTETETELALFTPALLAKAFRGEL